MKISPILVSIANYDNIDPIIVHTGQHYDKEMSENILSDLEFPKPHHFLNVGGGSHAVQTSKIFIEFEKICIKHRPHLVVVAGDVNSTLGCAIVASKLSIKIAHVESGLRSFDRSMPEEINRILTDQISDLLFTSEESGNKNLIKEGLDTSKIHFVGNCMIDSLTRFIADAKKARPWLDFGFLGKDYMLLTLHRPSNVDELKSLKNILDDISIISKDIPVIFPIHPRTHNNIKILKYRLTSSVIISEPLPYIQFLGIMSKAKFVLTDSGGIQEETTMLRVPCITLRENTERPVTINEGTNILAGKDSSKIHPIVKKILIGENKIGITPKYWDGKSGERIAKILHEYLK